MIQRLGLSSSVSDMQLGVPSSSESIIKSRLKTAGAEVSSGSGAALC